MAFFRESALFSLIVSQEYVGILTVASNHLILGGFKDLGST